MSILDFIFETGNMVFLSVILFFIIRSAVKRAIIEAKVDETELINKLKKERQK